MNLQPIWDQLEPTIVQIVGLALAALLAWIGMKVKTLVGINIDAALRDSIKASMTTGAQAAQFDGKTGDAAVAATVAYVQAAKPDQIKAVAMTPAVLTSNAKSKVVETAVATTAAENTNSPGSSSTVAAKLP